MRRRLPRLAPVSLALAAIVSLDGHAARGASAECGIVRAAAPDKPFYVEAIVLGPANDAEVLSQTKIAIDRAHAPVSPAYVNLPRIDALFRDPAGVQHRIIAAVIDGPLPSRGARVTLASRHRDPNAACAFVPWTVAPKGSGI